MKSLRKRLGLGLGMALLLGTLLAMASMATATAGAPISDDGVTPEEYAGNVSCQLLGYQYGFKIEGQGGVDYTGTFPFDLSNGGIHTGGAPDDAFNSVTTSSDGYYLDWSSTLGIDAVIMKGGPDSNVYVYVPEDTSDGGLASPRLGNGNLPEISHVEFCYDYEVDVSKTAETTFTRTYDWTIDKSVTPDSWDLFTGDSGTSKYTVTVEKTGYTDSDWAVSGQIFVTNNTPLDATVESVGDAISGGIYPDVICPPLPLMLGPGDGLTCAYATGLPDGSTRTNTATVTTSGMVGGGEAIADVIFGEPTTVVNDSINVDDTNGGSWMLSDSGSVMYEKTFTCGPDEGTHDNTATIRETGQSDDASVTVNCYDLTVSKDAYTTFDRDWTWTIDKSADETDLTLSSGQVFTVNYSVTVEATSTDSNWAVSGEIKISNPHPTRDAVLTAVTDLVSPEIAANVSCDSLTVPAGGSLTCTYDADLPDAASRTNTATATLQNFDFASDGAATVDGTTDFEGQTDVVFGTTPTNETDECISVTDSRFGVLGDACASTSPTTFFYSVDVGPYDTCGTYTVENTASFVTNDTGATGSDSWTVNVDVPCYGGCSLTQGYWRTHSEYGPAPYDDTWALLANGADTPFFLSGQTYHEVLWTSPSGNAYYILAQQYIAAELNFLNGADPTAAQAAFDQATGLFETYTPDQIGALKGNKPLRTEFLELATILDNYNNGLIGPGHCSE